MVKLPQGLIFFDARHISKGGIGVYIGEVLNRLVEMDVSLCLLTNNKHEIEKYIIKKNVTYLIAPKLFSITEQLWFLIKYPTFYKKIYVSPYLTYPLFVKTHLIYIVHDLIWLHNPKFATGKAGYYYFKYFLRKGIGRSNQIISISHNTKNDILRFNKDFEPKISVFYNGLNREEFTNVLPMKPGYQYFIYIGTWKPWKNVPLLLKAYQYYLDVVNKTDHLKLVLCGDNKTKMADDVEGIISNNSKLSSNVIVTGKVERTQLLSWIKGAVALIQPSMFEGFGMALIEGLALGVPVICSDIPVFKEIAQENVHYFQTGSVEDLTNRMLVITKSSNRQHNLDKEIIYQKFNWQRVADFIFEVYKKNQFTHD